MLSEAIKNKLKVWEEKKLWRNRIISSDFTIKNQGINFCSNDYLSLNQHPAINQALRNAIDRYGFGSGASAMVSGYHAIHADLEAEFATWLGQEKAILFGSGYLANLGVIGSLVDRGNTVISDKLIHASLLDAIQLSRAKHYRYQHLCLTDLQDQVERFSPDYIITESVFSMSGEITPIDKIDELIAQSNTNLIIDDAHGLGIIGEQGRGAIRENKISSTKIACVINPLGKSFNAVGAMVSGDKAVIDAILQFAKPYRYTTATPPLVAAGILATLKVIQSEQWRREKLLDLINFFIESAEDLDIRLVSKDLSPIKSIVLKDNQSLLALQKQLLFKGYRVAAIRPPTVPQGQAIIKLCLNCQHTKQDVSGLLKEIAGYL